MLVFRENKNHILIWIFIINVMKGVSLSTYLKVVFYMKCWIPPMSCSFQLTQHCCTPNQMYIVTGFVTLVYEQTLWTLHRKTLKLLCKIKKLFCLWQVTTNLAWLRNFLWSYFVTIIRTLVLNVPSQSFTGFWICFHF